MPGARAPDVEVAALRRERLEDGLQGRDHVPVAADHERVANLEAPIATDRSAKFTGNRSPSDVAAFIARKQATIEPVGADREPGEEVNEIVQRPAKLNRERSEATPRFALEPLTTERYHGHHQA